MATACATVAVVAAHAATAPKALRATVLKTELAQHSVHFVTITSSAGVDPGMGIRARDVADVARDRGIQRWTVVSQNGQTGHLTILLVHSTAYVRGDAFGLLWGGFGFFTVHAGSWLSVPHNSADYGNVVRNVTIGSLARDDVPRNHLALVRGTAGGRAMRGLRGVVHLQAPSNSVAMTRPSVRDTDP